VVGVRRRVRTKKEEPMANAPARTVAVLVAGMLLIATLAVAANAVTDGSDGSGASPGCDGVAIPSGGNIAQASASHPRGTTFCLSGRYELAAPVEPVEGQTFRGPATIVGVNGNDTGFFVTRRHVRFFDLDMSGFDERAIRCMYGTRVVRGRYHHNGINGIGCGLTRSAGGGVVIRRVEIDHNGSEAMIGRSSAAIKLAGSPGSKVLYSNVHDNVGNGIWFDVDSGSDQPDEIIGNVVTGNSMRGIFYEVSRGYVVITDNVVTGNNTSSTPGASGIGVSSSKNVTIERNLVEGNLVWSIRANDIDRGYDLQNVVIRDNDVADTPLYGCDFTGVTCTNNE